MAIRVLLLLRHTGLGVERWSAQGRGQDGWQGSPQRERERERKSESECLLKTHLGEGRGREDRGDGPGGLARES